MKKLFFVLALAAITSCSKSELLCGYIVEKGQDWDPVFGIWENYITLELDNGRLEAFNVTQRDYRTAIVGDYACYE